MKDDTQVTDFLDIANTLAENFSKNSSITNYSQTFQTYKTSQEKRHLNFKSNNLENYNLPFSLQELSTAINSSHDTAAGPDEIHYQLLKHLPDGSLKLLLDIFNGIWESGNFPDSWREATVIAIPKPGKETSDANSYRPIALTSCLCKTMERMVNNRLVYFLESNNLITELQSGFRKQRSTDDQLIRLETWIREGFLNREHVVAVFFDLEKAYDTAWKHGVLADLFRLGLRGNLPIFISQYLSHRSFRVRVGTTLSELYEQEEGYPQGGILSVTLFQIKINTIAKCLAPGIESSLYVDDFLACYRSKQMRTIERRLQQGLNNLQVWADQNGFRFSKQKTVCMHFCKLRRLHLDPILHIDNIAIPVVHETKFLGILFDDRLSFIPHLRYLKTRCSKAMNLLRVVANRDWGADFKTLILLYRSLIRSKLDYGSIVYGSARRSYLEMLEPVQNRALKLCLGAFRTSPIDSLRVEANEPPLTHRRTKLSVLYCLKIKSNPLNPTHQCIFNNICMEKFLTKPTMIPPLCNRFIDYTSNMHFDLSVIAKHQSISNIPPWTIKLPHINWTMHSKNKATTDPEFFQILFHEMLEVYPEHSRIYTDGSKDGELVGSAAVSRDAVRQCRLPKWSTIFTAEIIAIGLALDIVEVSNNNKYLILSDSLSSLQAINNTRWDNPLVLQVRERCHGLFMAGKTVDFAWVPSHVGIVGNEKADVMANDALKLPMAEIKIPWSDFRQDTESRFRADWQLYWDSIPPNKLRTVKPTLGVPAFEGISKRRDELVLHRARIGHTHLTHGYLLKGEDQPQCIPCSEELTIEHILIHCVDFAETRDKYFNVQSLHELFSTVKPVHIIGFLKEIQLYNKL